MPETGAILAWTLVSECPIPNDVNDLLVEGEVAVAAYKTYQKSMSMSKSAIYDQLTSEYGEKFTKEEAQYAIDHLDD